MNAAMTRIATAQKINSAKDNASVWAISQKMRERMRANDQANQNAQNDSALLKTAQGGLDNTLSILNTLKERAVNAANDSNVSGDRAKIAEEVRQLVSQIDENANKVKFNGRVLLNGGGEVSAASSGGTVAANAVTATGNYGNMAVYSLNNLSTGTSTSVASTTALVDLVGKNGETLFQVGDKITFNWTDNGVAKQASVSVATSATALSDLSPGDGLTGTTFKAGAAITGASDAASKQLYAETTSLYFTGTAGNNISNLSISVTGANGLTNTAAQEALTPVAIQQSYGDTSRGSNTVWEGAKLTPVAANGPVAGDQTTLTALGLADNYKIQVNDTALEFSNTTKLSDISQAFKDRGINVELHYAGAAKDPLTFEGSTVTKGTYGSTANYGVTTEQTLSIVGAPNQDVFYVAFGSTQATKKMTADTGDASAAATSSGILPRGQALQFFVGGEQNFGVNFAIGKATAGNLLGGTADSFASKFLTKEGANSAIGIIDNAISKTLTEQTRLGAMEARLGYTSDNLVTMNENLESGVAAYIGSDMAKEMTDYMKYSVTSQAAQYMLANAGQNAYNVLQLLQP
jgi:flagellin